MVQGDLQYAVRSNELGSWVVLPEIMGESFDGPGIRRELEGARTIVFDCERISRITSFGIREWIRFLRTIPEDSYYCFVRCPPIVVAQLNATAGITGRGEVLSIYLPYVCPSCNDRKELLVDVAREKERGEEVRYPRMSCERCEIPSELDELPEIYLSWVSKHPRPMPPLDAIQLIGQSKPNEKSRAR
jgi:hypothetical protein